jgi:hypothetical protein
MENIKNIEDNNKKTQDEKYTDKDQIENKKDAEEDIARKSNSSFEFQNPNNNILNLNNIFNNNNSQIGYRNEFNNNINNLNNSINNQIIYFLANQFLEIKGWILLDKYGNKINDFNSLELLDYLTEKVSENIDLDNYKILAQDTENYYKGGNLFLSLFDMLSLVLLQKKEEYNKQIINLLLQINNNNYGFNNDFSFNLGNNINFPYNYNLYNNLNLNNNLINMNN